MSTRKIKVAPSLLSADLGYLDKEIKSVRESNCEWLHYDIMDGDFVPNITFGPDFVKRFHTYGLFNDVHFMIKNPLKYAKVFVDNGADLITFHYEVTKDPIAMQEEIRKLSKDIKVGLSIKPRTKVEDILPFVNYFDLILVMSVEPGFGGQKFIPSSLDKIKTLRKYIDDNKLNTLIEVDGGVNGKTYKDCLAAGVDVLVTGSYYFSQIDRAKTVKMLKGELDA